MPRVIRAFADYAKHFCLLLAAWSERWPGIYFYLFAAPGFLHVASYLLARPWSGLHPQPQSK
jgi:hypothetical protein